MSRDARTPLTRASTFLEAADTMLCAAWDQLAEISMQRVRPKGGLSLPQIVGHLSNLRAAINAAAMTKEKVT